MNTDEADNPLAEEIAQAFKPGSVEGLLIALERIADCDVRVPGDVVDVARTALADYRGDQK